MRRVYGPAECTALALDTPLPAGHSGAHRLASAAADFAAKEAFGKALGIGVAAPATLPNIAVVHDELGKPSFAYAPELAQLLTQRGLIAHLSISDEKEFALAFVVLEHA